MQPGETSHTPVKIRTSFRWFVLVVISDLNITSIGSEGLGTIRRRGNAMK